MGTPDFAIPPLQMLIDGEHNLVGVYTQEDKPSGRRRTAVPSPVKRFAIDHNLPIFQPDSLKSVDEVARLAELHPDIVVVAAFGQILTQSILDIPPHGCLNIHPSLLPRHRGPSPVTDSILCGDEIGGVTLMLMDKGLDTGPIIAQQTIPIAPEETTGSLTQMLAQLGAQLLMEKLTDWMHGRITPEQQDHKRATYSHLITKEMGKLSWQTPASELSRMVRAFQPWPSCYTTWRRMHLKIIEVSPISTNPMGQIGQVVNLRQSEAPIVGVQTSDGVLEISKVQPAGKRVMTIHEFTRGQKEFLGSLLSSE